MSLLDQSKSWVQRDFGLDRRLIKALSKLGYVYPTLVQARCIPLALHGKDVVVRARTGSGKTIAFSLPLLQKILLSKDGGGGGEVADATAKIHCLILVPTKELCKQIEKHVTELIYYLKDIIRVTALADDNTSMQAFRLKSKPDIVISTPAKLVQHMRSGAVDLSFCKTLVIDEADLVLSFGYAEDVHKIKQKMPKIFQGMLMSATLSPELEKFKRVTLHNPAILKLEEAESGGHLVQFYLGAKENDKFLILYVFLRLGLVQGKGLVFVNDVNKCYRLKLFLQQFGIQAAVLNAEIPVNSRMHILDEFNRGVFDYLIATDASLDTGNEDDAEDDDAEDDDDDDDDDDDNGEGAANEEEDVGMQAVADDDAPGEGEDDGEDIEDDGGEDEEGEGDEAMDEGADKQPKGRKTGGKADQNPPSSSSSSSSSQSKKRKLPTSTDKDSQYGVSRGIDFVDVSFVINFDFPKTSAAYTHRIGRTARGGASGTALSFVTTVDPSTTGLAADPALADAELLRQVRDQQPRLNSADGDSVLSAMGAVNDPAFADSNEEARKQPAPLMFDIHDIETFRYRVEDTLRAVTQSSVKEFRAAELKREILNSAKLKSYFASNPTDLKVLRHESAVAHPIKPKDHLKHVPDYLIPASMRSIANTTQGKKKRRKVSGQSDQRIQKSKMKDPLLNAGAVTDANAAGADEGDDEADDTAGGDNSGKMLTSSELANQSAHSTSGRRAWQERHKVGKFRASTKNNHRVEGTFTKSKRYK